LGLREWILW